MPLSPSGRERLLWIAIFLYLGAIYGSAYFVRFLSQHLRERELLAPTIAGLGAAGVVVFLTWWARARPGPVAWLLLARAASLYLDAWTALERFEERIHLLEYGLLGILLHRGLALHWRRHRRLRRLPAVGAFVLVLAAGWLDEGLQYLLPNRFYDLRDVALNAFAGALAIGLVAARGTPFLYNGSEPKGAPSP